MNVNKVKPTLKSSLAVAVQYRVNTEKKALETRRYAALEEEIDEHRYRVNL